jgi:hypothetical protein
MLPCRLMPAQQLRGQPDHVRYAVAQLLVHQSSVHLLLLLRLSLAPFQGHLQLPGCGGDSGSP